MVPGTLRVWLSVAPVKMSKSIDGLSAVVVEQLAQDPKKDGVFVFVNAKRDRAKLLWRDSTGWCLLYKRLDARVVALPVVVAKMKSVTIDARALSALLEGVVRARNENPRKIAHESRAKVMSMIDKQAS